MKVLFLCLLSVVLPATALALVNVQIEEVGLKGYYSGRFPTPVRVRLTSAQAGAVRLEFKVSTADDDTRPRLVRADKFSLNVNVVPDVLTELDVPLPLAGSNESKLEVTAVDSAGHDVGSSSIGLSPQGLQSNQSLVAIVCGERLGCDEAQTQITFSGSTEDVSQKNESLKFVTLQSPREHWWDYTVAAYVVIAGQISGWTRESRDALEYYVRAGGTLILLDKQIDDPAFLSPYRPPYRQAPYQQEGSKIEPVVIGLGRLYSLTSLESKALGTTFSGPSLKRMHLPPRLQYYGNLVEWLRDKVGVTFSFPRLRWLIVWLIVYVVVVGLLNFALLRRLRRLEWGWVTTSAIAILFAVGLYISSSANRPHNVTLDDVAVYWMDAHSPIAWEDIGLRISSPQRQTIAVSVADGAMLQRSGNSYDSETPTAEIAGQITEARQHQRGWDVSLGPPFETALPLLRWSFSDLNLGIFHVFPGSVTLSSGSRLKNDTGENFQQALYFDFPNNKRYIIPSLAAGEEIDITNLASEAILFDRDANVSTEAYSAGNFSFSIVKRSGPAPLKDIPNGFSDTSTKHVFVGLSEGPVPLSDLSVENFSRHNFALTVVSLDQP